MEYEDLLKNFDDLNKQISNLYKEMREKSTNFLEVAAKKAFDLAPEIGQFHWTQYTPYFNDGEECVFSVNEVCFWLQDEEFDMDFYESSTLYSEKDLKSYEEKLKEAKDFAKDPYTWRENYIKNYKNKHGREPWNWNRQDQIKPYYTVQECEDRIQEIKDFMLKYDPETQDRIKNAYGLFKNAVEKIDEDIMKAIYGDHVSIIVTREGTEIDEYSHD